MTHPLKTVVPNVAYETFLPSLTVIGAPAMRGKTCALVDKVAAHIAELGEKASVFHIDLEQANIREYYAARCPAGTERVSFVQGPYSLSALVDVATALIEQRETKPTLIAIDTIPSVTPDWPTTEKALQRLNDLGTKHGVQFVVTRQFSRETATS